MGDPPAPSCPCRHRPERCSACARESVTTLYIDRFVILAGVVVYVVAWLADVWRTP